METENFPESEGIVKNLTIIFLSLAGGQFLFLCIILFITPPGNLGQAKELNRYFLYPLPVITIGAIVLSSFLFCRRKKLAYTVESNDEKLEIYKGAIILRFALIEVANLLSLAAYFLTLNKLYIVLFAIAFIVFLLYRPSQKKLNTDLDEELAGSGFGCGG